MGLFFKASNNKESVFKKELEAAIKNADTEALTRVLEGMGDLSRRLLSESLQTTIEKDMPQSADLLLRYGAALPNALESRPLRGIIYDNRMDMYRVLVSHGADFDTQAATPDLSSEAFSKYKRNLAALKQKLEEDKKADGEKRAAPQIEPLLREMAELKEELVAIKGALQQAGIEVVSVAQKSRKDDRTFNLNF